MASTEETSSRNARATPWVTRVASSDGAFAATDSRSWALCSACSRTCCQWAGSASRWGGTGIRSVTTWVCWATGAAAARQAAHLRRLARTAQMMPPMMAASTRIPNTHQPHDDPLSDAVLTGAAVGDASTEAEALGATTAALDVSAVGVDVTRGGRAVVVAVAVTVAGGAVVGGAGTAALFEGCGCDGNDRVGVVVTAGSAPHPPPPQATAPPSRAAVTHRAGAPGRGSEPRSRCTVLLALATSSVRRVPPAPQQTPLSS